MKKQDSLLKIPGKNQVGNDLPNVLRASAIEEPASCSRLETGEDSAQSFSDIVLETDFGLTAKKS